LIAPARTARSTRSAPPSGWTSRTDLSGCWITAGVSVDVMLAIVGRGQGRRLRLWSRPNGRGQGLDIERRAGSRSGSLEGLEGAPRACWGEGAPPWLAGAGGRWRAVDDGPMSRGRSALSAGRGFPPACFWPGIPRRQGHVPDRPPPRARRDRAAPLRRREAVTGHALADLRSGGLTPLDRPPVQHVLYQQLAVVFALTAASSAYERRGNPSSGEPVSRQRIKVPAQAVCAG